MRSQEFITEIKKTKIEHHEANFTDMFRKFLPLAMHYLKLKDLPKMKFQRKINDETQPTYGKYVNHEKTLYVQLMDRNPNDILRTVAHELAHYKQDTEHQLDGTSGHTGSPQENEAHAMAGIVMRHFNKKYPDYLLQKPITENFADKKIKGKSRPGRVKKAGASCKGSVSSLRKKAKQGGERGKMYHWCANMKSGKKKTNENVKDMRNKPFYIVMDRHGVKGAAVEVKHEDVHEAIQNISSLVQSGQLDIEDLKKLHKSLAADCTKMLPSIALTGHAMNSKGEILSREEFDGDLVAVAVYDYVANGNKIGITDNPHGTDKPHPSDRSEPPSGKLHESLKEKWTKKYKKSINCAHPKGFSQKAHCAGRKKRKAGGKTKSKSVSEGKVVTGKWLGSASDYSTEAQRKDIRAIADLFVSSRKLPPLNDEVSMNSLTQQIIDFIFDNPSIHKIPVLDIPTIAHKIAALLWKENYGISPRESFSKKKDLAEINRRDFLKYGAAAATAGAMGLGARKLFTPNQNQQIPQAQAPAQELPKKPAFVLPKPRVLNSEQAAELKQKFENAAIAAGIKNKSELAALLAQSEIETAHFTRLREMGSMEYFKKYDGKLGNTEEFDGARYCGRGLLHLTGKNSYAAASKVLNVDLVSKPELLEQDINLAIQSALWFWKSYLRHKVHNFNNTKQVTKAVTGSPIQALKDRIEAFKHEISRLTHKDKMKKKKP